MGEGMSKSRSKDKRGKVVGRRERRSSPEVETALSPSQLSFSSAFTTPDRETNTHPDSQTGRAKSDEQFRCPVRAGEPGHYRNVTKHCTIDQCFPGMSELKSVKLHFSSAGLGIGLTTAAQRAHQEIPLVQLLVRRLQEELFNLHRRQHCEDQERPRVCSERLVRSGDAGKSYMDL